MQLRVHALTIVCVSDSDVRDMPAGFELQLSFPVLVYAICIVYTILVTCNKPKKKGQFMRL